MKRVAHIEHVTDRDVQRFLMSSWVDLSDENTKLRRQNRDMKRAIIALVVITLLTLAAAARAESPADGVAQKADAKKSAAIPAQPAASTPPSAGPAAASTPLSAGPKPLSDAQKLEIREFQLRSANAQQQLDQLELRARDLTQAQQQNTQQMQARVAAIVKEACAVPQGCDLDYESLSVRARPAPPVPAPAPAEKK